MGVSTFLGLNIGVNALDAFQQAENVVSNNISNANTPGYAQETANLSEGLPFPTPGNSTVVGQLAQGSFVSSITRQVSEFINQQDRANQGNYQMYSTHSNVLDQVQSILNEPSSNSIQNALDQFFSAWQSLSSNPSSTAARGSVISQAQTLSQTYGTVTSQLEQLQSSLVNVATGGSDTPVYNLSNAGSSVSGVSITLVQPQLSDGSYSVSYSGNTLTLLDSNGHQLGTTTISTTSSGSYTLGSPTGVEFQVSIPTTATFGTGGALATSATLSLQPETPVLTYSDSSTISASTGTMGTSLVSGSISVSGSSSVLGNQYEVSVSGTSSTYTVTLMDASGDVLGTAVGSSTSTNTFNISGTGSAAGDTFNFTIPTLTTLYSGTSSYSQTDLVSTSGAASGGQLGELNQYAAQLAELNSQIVKTEKDGENPNTLLDQRGTVLNNMSKIANISYTITPLSVNNPTPGMGGQETLPGAVNVQIGSLSLVSGTTSNQLTYSGLSDLVNKQQLTSGTLAGNVQGIQDTQHLLHQFDSFLTALSTQVNAVQTNGYGLSGTSKAPPLFSATTDAAGHVRLSVPLTSTDEIAASDSPNLPGNNNNVINMIQLQSATNYNGGTLDQGVAKIVSQVGIEAGAVNSSKSTANALAQQSSSMRQSISGVDTNQQAALMVQYQNSYDAAAKFIATFNQMMQALMNITP